MKSAIALVMTAMTAMTTMAACGSKGPAQPTTVGGTSASGEGGGGGAPAPAAKVVEGKLVRLESGDAACYVVLEIGGAEQSLPGTFELCAGGGQDASALVGKVVVGTTKKDKIIADSCQGNPECKDSKDVDLVMSLAAK